MEADFRQYYGIRLVDEWPTMSFREFKALLGRLPSGSRIAHIMEHQNPTEVLNEAEAEAAIRELL